jgi:hypothetical protein
VRQRCGFGCVRCGFSLYDYEHFDPDFKDATEHNPEGITLLCMQCNQKRNRKVLSVESVRSSNDNPICLQQGFANEAFDFGSEPIEVVFAGVTFTNCTHLIRVSGIPILSVGADNWDVECEGPKITIRRGPGDIVLVLKSEPPKRLVIERLNMEFEGMFFRGSQDLLEIYGDQINWMQWQGCGMTNCFIGMEFN